MEGEEKKKDKPTGNKCKPGLSNAFNYNQMYQRFCPARVCPLLTDGVAWKSRHLGLQTWVQELPLNSCHSVATESSGDI